MKRSAFTLVLTLVAGASGFVAYKALNGSLMPLPDTGGFTADATAATQGPPSHASLCSALMVGEWLPWSKSVAEDGEALGSAITHCACGPPSSGSQVWAITCHGLADHHKGTRSSKRANHVVRRERCICSCCPNVARLTPDWWLQ